MVENYPLYDFFRWIGHIFEDFLFIPIDQIRHLQDESWWAANAINWVFMIIFFVLFGYWLFKLKIFYDHDKNNLPDFRR